MTNYHLVILKQPYLNAILDGRKQIESRFTKTKREPIGQIRPGDRLFLKESSGPVRAVATAAAIKNFCNLTPGQIAKIRQRYNGQIRGTDGYWRGKADCRFGFLVWLNHVEPIEPVRIHKRDWRAWVVLTAKENFGLLKVGAIKKMTPQ